jgi:hypothetical protein
MPDWPVSKGDACREAFAVCSGSYAGRTPPHSEVRDSAYPGPVIHLVESNHIAYRIDP